MTWHESVSLDHKKTYKKQCVGLFVKEGAQKPLVVQCTAVFMTLL
jgi:hypothetical protein